MSEDKLLSAERIYLQPEDNDPLSAINKFFCPWMVRDRFGILNKYSPYRLSDIADPIPKAFDQYRPIATILDEVARRMLTTYERITVSWSGGVDSTSVVVALLRNMSDADRKRLTIICSQSSCEENPKFYEMMCSMGLNIIVSEDLRQTLIDADTDVITSGWCADQLYGSDIHLTYPAAYNMNWIDAIKFIWEAKNGTRLGDKSASAIERIYQGYAHNLGVELTDFCEFAWMFNFGCKFSYIRNIMRCQLAGTKNQEKTEGFFDDILFQRWSIGNFENIKHVNIYERPRHYKHALKLYIYEFTEDEAYYRDKGKRNSWGMSHIPVRDFTVVTENNELKTYRYKDKKVDLETLGALNAFVRKEYRR